MIIFKLQNKQIINNQEDKWKMTPEKAQKMLSDEGMNVTLPEAAEILSFLKLMAGAVVKKFLEDSASSNNDRKGRFIRNSRN